jgi:predicted O-linked N-acetylglucosamine transferase (SPINDLY family)
MKLFERGLLLHKQGNLFEAKKIYETIIEKEPQHFDSLHLLGVIAYQKRNYQLSVDLIDRAILLDPSNAAFYSNRGNALKELKRNEEALYCYDKAISLKSDYFGAYNNRGIILKELKRKEEALSSYNKAININPNYAEAYYNRALILKELKRNEEALSSYDKAIKINPNYAEAYYNRGLLLQELKRNEEALFSYYKAIKINPNYAEAYNNIGITLHELKKLKEAIVIYNKAIDLKPDYAEAYNNYGNVLKELKRNEEALSSYDKAIKINPNYAEAYYNRGIVLQELFYLNEAKTSYAKALHLKSDFYIARWAMPFVTILTSFLGINNINEIREIFLNELEELDKWFTEETLEKAYTAVGSRQPFYLAYQELNNKKILSQYGKISNRLMNYWQKKNNLEFPKINKSKKIKIGIIIGDTSNYSVWNAITKGLMMNLDRNKFEIHAFCLENSENDQTNFIKKNSTSFTKNQPELLDLVNLILKKNIEMLIYPEIGMHQLTSQLANMRLCPTQIALWGHPETSGLPTIDYYLSAELFETNDSQESYTESLIKLPNLGCCYSRLPVVASKLDISKLGLDTKSPVLLCPGMPFKYQPQNDWIWVDIAKKLGKCNLVFFDHQKSWTSILKTRLEKLFKEQDLDIDDYVFFIPWLKKEEFYGLMKCADVFLDTIGFSGFNTAIQAVDCALPIITKEGRFARGRLASGILKRIGITELIVNTENEYIQLAIRLVQDKRYRDHIAKKIIKNRDVLYNDKSSILALENFLTNKVQNDL